ncbi:mitochondrial inner membrane protein required for protein import [Teratosphaeriaceae sp. CCFEE 6253]|nr:mitochondrial inner membrane protein required for protein import [Teratosphaeriaceae sp. CCFEE 6253]
MLPRATRLALRPASLQHIRQPRPSTTLQSQLRTYTDRPRRPPPPAPRPTSGRPTPRSPPPPPHASAATRQTSPGTSINDQTWKPSDGIKFAAPPLAANAANRAEDAASGRTSVDGTRPVDAEVRQGVLESDAQAPQEPIAQQTGADSPIPGSVRDAAWEAQAAAENTPPPPEAPAEPEPEPQQPQQPLPDLRQGLPSTFDMEYGSGRANQMRTDRPSEQTDGVDPTSTTPREKAGGDGGGERDYDRRAYETSLDRRRAQMANWLYASILFSTLTGAFYLARPYNPAQEDPPAGFLPTSTEGWAPGAMWSRMRARLGSQVGYYTEPTFPKLLPDVPPDQRPPYTLVLSLEDLLIHNTWDRTHGYRTAKRPGLDYFLRYLSQYYELVLFTTSPLSMADPIIKKLDPYHFVMWPLGREATRYENGAYVKDLSYLNRDLSKTVILDTNAAHVSAQPENAILLPKWNGEVGDPRAPDLVRLIPFLENLAAMTTEDVRVALKSFEGKDIATEFGRREQVAREALHAQLAADNVRRPRRSLGGLASSLGLSSAGGGGGGGGGMVLADGSTVAAGYAKGLTLSDQIRVQGQKQYEAIETQIRDHGASWLREEEEEQKKAVEAQMREMKKGALGWFGGKKE